MNRSLSGALTAPNALIALNGGEKSLSEGMYVCSKEVCM